MANGDLTPSFNLLGDMKRGPLSRFNSLVLKMSFELIKLYNQLGPLTQKEDFFNWKQLLEEILQFFVSLFMLEEVEFSISLWPKDKIVSE